MASSVPSIAAPTDPVVVSTGWMVAGVCYTDATTAIKVGCAGIRGVSSAGSMECRDPQVYSTSAGSDGTALDFLYDLVVSNSSPGNVQSVSDTQALARLQSCTVQPTAWDMPSPADAAMAFSWGLTGILLVYMATWGSARVLEAIRS